MRKLTTVYLKMHYSFDTFNDELSERTLESFIKAWDSGKLYFLDSDIVSFKKKYAKKLDDMIMSANCKAIDDVVNVFGQRFKERRANITKQNGAPHDFKIDEHLIIDRKKLEWAQLPSELDERWRQRIKFQALQLRPTLKNDMKKVQEKLEKRQELADRRHEEQTQDEVYARFLNAFASSLDPHSDYMSVDQLEDFRIQTRLSLEGIGAVLRTDDGFTVVQSLVPGGAAEKSGLVKVEDKIIAVAQIKGTPVDVIDMDLREVVKLIRGTGGTTVNLTLVREENGKTVQIVAPVVREKVQLTDRTAKSKVVPVAVKDGTKTKEIKVGLLSLPSFYIDFEGQNSKRKDYRSSARDLDQEIRKLKSAGIDGMVLDLRSNGGGSLTESIKVAGLFFDSGPVVQIKETSGDVYPHADTDGLTSWDGPLVVMISRQSASASEIFAGAIQDYGRGLIVGDDHTFGKGTVQNLHDIGEKLGAVKVTISKFYRPSGSSTQLNGVASDIVLPSLISEIDIGEKFYDHALTWDQIKLTPFEKFELVKPYVAQLSSLSAARLKKDAKFIDIQKEITEYRTNEKERSQVSLKEESEKDKEKAKDKDKASKLKEKVESEDENSLDELNIEADPYLQESVRITSDYIQLIKKQLPSFVSIPQLEKAGASKTKKSKT